VFSYKPFICYFLSALSCCAIPGEGVMVRMINAKSFYPQFDFLHIDQKIWPTPTITNNPYPSTKADINS
jgi:hypothetical protein